MLSSRYFLPVVWIILIFILSSIPGNYYPTAVFDYAPVAHFGEFFILSILVLRATVSDAEQTVIKDKTIFLVLIFCVLIALSDEVHQIFVTNRTASLGDWLVDCLAILTAIKFYLFLKPNKN